MNDRQFTIRNSQRYSGIALHTGVRAHLSFHPAPVNNGITLIRTDLPGRPRIEALATNVISVERATTLGNGDARVHTVEHVLAALYACGIDNAVIEMDGPEPPIADGSSNAYVAMVVDAGLESQSQERRQCRVTKPIFLKQEDSQLIVLPADEYRITCTVKYNDGSLDTQYLSLPITRNIFIDELAGARTFCLYREIEELMVKGLIRGGSLDNAVVLKEGAIISKDGLRYPDEFVRHKMLDIIGDLSLIGKRLIAEVVAIKPGHPLNVAMARKLTTI